MVCLRRIIPSHQLVLDWSSAHTQQNQARSTTMVFPMIITAVTTGVLITIGLFVPQLHFIFEGAVDKPFDNTFLVSVLIMIVHKLESYVSREFENCPFYLSLTESWWTQPPYQVQRVTFLTFVFTFLSAMLLNYLVLLGSPWPLLLLGIWCMQCVHELHHVSKSFARRSYYPGAYSATVFALHGTFFMFPRWVSHLNLVSLDAALAQWMPQYPWLTMRLVLQTLYVAMQPLLLLAYYQGDIAWLKIHRPYVLETPSQRKQQRAEEQPKTPRNQISDATHACVLITGAAQGLGKELALLYSQPGHTVAICDMNRERLTQTAKAVEQRGGTCVFDVVDVTNQQQMVAFVQRVDAIQPLDLVIANAGVNSKQSEITQVNVNCLGVVHTCEAALSVMQARGRGHIAMLASLAAMNFSPTEGTYSATKAFVRSYGLGLAVKLRPQNIFVTVVAPGFIRINPKGPLQWSYPHAADYIFVKLQQRPLHIVFPRLMHVLSSLWSFLPDALLMSVYQVINKSDKVAMLD